MSSFIPLTEPAFQILLSLGDAARHGYAIMQEVEQRTEGRVRLGPGTLYGAIRRLRDQELIEELERAPVREEENDERRRYYRLTSAGRATATAEARRLERLVGTARAKQLLPAEGGT